MAGSVAVGRDGMLNQQKLPVSTINSTVLGM